MLAGSPSTLTETFTLDIFDPCPTSLLDPFNPIALTVSELGPASTINLPQIQDSASRLNTGDGLTHCGPRGYRIVTPQPARPLTVTLKQSAAEGQTLTLESTDNTDAGTYSVQVEVYLINYPGVVAVQTTVTMTVTECVVTAINSLAPFDGTTIEYRIHYSSLTTVPFDYVQVPACDYPLTTTPTIAPLSAAVTFDGVANTFTLSSTDFNDAATGIAVSIDVTLTGDPFAINETFTADIIDSCVTAAIVGESI